MKTIWRKIWEEPAIALGIPTVCLAAGAGIWNEPWLAFGAAASVAISALFVRANVTADDPRGHLDNL